MAPKQVLVYFSVSMLNNMLKSVFFSDSVKVTCVVNYVTSTFGAAHGP